MAKSFGFTQIIMQEYVHKIARPVVLSDTFFYINACSQMVCASNSNRLCSSPRSSRGRDSDFGLTLAISFDFFGGAHTNAQARQLISV